MQLSEIANYIRTITKDESVEQTLASPTQTSADSIFADQLSSMTQSKEEKIAAINDAVMATRQEEPDPVKDFLEFMDKTTAEIMREMILKELGITEEQLEALPAEERRKIEQMITDLIEQRMQRKAEEQLEKIQKGQEQKSTESVSGQLADLAQSDKQTPFDEPRNEEDAA